MSGFSQFITPLLVDHITGKVNYPEPTVHLALLKTSATATSTGATLDEPTSLEYEDYARLVFDSTSMTTAAMVGSNASSSNAHTLSFQQAGGASTGCSAVGFAGVDSSVPGTGNVLWFGDFLVPFIIGAGNTPAIETGDVTFISSDTLGATDYLVRKVVDHISGRSPFIQPTELWAALLTGNVGASLVGTEPDAVAAWINYTRVAIPVDSWSAASIVSGKGQSVTDATVDFPTSGGLSTGAAVIGLGLFDAFTGGNQLFYASITPQTISAHMDTFFDLGGLTIQVG